MKHLLWIVSVTTLAATTAWAQPVISGTAGSFSNGSTVTVTGSGFGVKAVPGPKIWDRAEGTNLATFWDDWEPTTAGNSTCNMAYRTVIRSVALPYAANNTKYAAGCHYGVDTSTGGNIVQLSDSRTATTYPYFSYWSYYWREDPAWSNGGGENTDGNNKIHVISNSEGLLAGNYWYTEYDARPTNSSVTPNFDISDSGGLGYRCRTAVVGACHSSGAGNVGYGVASNNPINGWIKTEIMIRWDRTTSGYALIYENGRKVYHTTGETDTNTSTSTRWEGIGVYSRARGINDWRYLDDIYFDTSVDAIAHVEICPGSTFANRGVCQNQPATAWGGSSVSFTMNRGGLPASGTAYIYVTDRNRNTNANGFAVNLGTQGPAAPTNLRIIAASLAAEMPWGLALIGALASSLMLTRRSKEAA